jgi:hypothetical protein
MLYINSFSLLLNSARSDSISPTNQTIEKLIFSDIFLTLSASRFAALQFPADSVLDPKASKR